ncbi:hypothetical protein ZWY2020_003958 [Hordeum vulgare]|nr:hypothetical protein ZWY2020_003958 [Hordeum vulgare]
MPAAPCHRRARRACAPVARSTLPLRSRRTSLPSRREHERQTKQWEEKRPRESSGDPLLREKPNPPRPRHPVTMANSGDEGRVVMDLRSAAESAGGDEALHEIESLCMRCGENGTTRLLLTTIPNFREVVLMAFECPHCSERNNEVQFAGQLQPKGCCYRLDVPQGQNEVLNRQVVKSDSATFKVEGIIMRAVEELQALQDERKVDTLPSTCGACGAACVTRFFATKIPYFREVIVMAASCELCGYRNSQLKPGGEIPAKGKKITLHVQNVEDLSRDVIKSDSAGLKVPELELELSMGTLGGIVTTVEGLIVKICESGFMDSNWVIAQMNGRKRNGMISSKDYQSSEFTRALDLNY